MPREATLPGVSRKRKKMFSVRSSCSNFKCFLAPLLLSSAGPTSLYTSEYHSMDTDTHFPPSGTMSFATERSCSFSRTSSLGTSRTREPIDDCFHKDDRNITLQEWQGWGTDSPVPVMIDDAIEYLKSLEIQTDAQLTFGGNGGKLMGEFKIQEDKKHRATYEALNDSEKKLQFFSARQIACRLLGSRGYLCQKCWLVLEDCMCSKITTRSFPNRIRLWVYMHPKDFLRQNNTGKLLWQVFGIQAATLCLFGITELEDIMWNEFRQAGKNKVFCLYPNKNAVPMSVQDYFSPDSLFNVHGLSDMSSGTNEDVVNFVLIDGTWNNSGAMFRRLKDHAQLAWGDYDLPCISLATGASAMHKLRPQPSLDRTCTAAAAVGLLYELQQLPQFCSYALHKKAEAVEEALLILLDALTARRIRMGRSITRKERPASNVV